MPIVSRLAVRMAERGIRGKDLAAQIGLSEANLSKLRTGRVRAIRFSTLEALCRALDCQPGDLLEYQEETP